MTSSLTSSWLFLLPVYQMLQISYLDFLVGQADFRRIFLLHYLSHFFVFPDKFHISEYDLYFMPDIITCVLRVLIYATAVNKSIQILKML